MLVNLVDSTGIIFSTPRLAKKSLAWQNRRAEHGLVAVVDDQEDSVQDDS
jgi:hypothetical protein